MSNEKLTKYRLKLAETNKKFYLDQLQIDLLTKNKLINFSIVEFLNYNVYSGRHRLSVNMQQILYGFLIEKDKYMCTAFKLVSSNGSESISSIYAYLYTKVNEELNSTNKSQYEHMFYCLGPTFISQDGEYRDMFLHYSRLDLILQKYQNQYEIVEQLVLQKIESGKIDIHLDMFYPIGYKENKNDFEEKINTSRLAVKFLVLCWLNDYYKIHIGITENHINPTYEQLIYDAADVSTLDKVFKSLDSTTKFHEMLHNIHGQQYYATHQQSSSLIPIQTCQKVFPMTVNELTNIHDINFDVWREMHTTIDAFELVLNFVSPSFPYLHEWFLIQNTNPNLFDNPQQQIKYERSKIAKDMMKQLKNARNLSLSDSGPMQEYRTFRDEKFEKTFIEVNKPINYLNSNLIISDCAMVFHMEQVNRTWRNYLHSSYNMEKSGFSHKEITKKFTNLNLFAKYLFEIIYGLYCLNSKLGIIHGDLHTNNATIFKLFSISKTHPTLQGKNPKILYVVEDDISGANFAENPEPCAFLFDHSGSYSVIIDFSQAILSNRNTLAGMFGENTADVYFKNQQQRIMELLHLRFADLVGKNKKQFMAAIDADLPGFIKAFSAYDTWHFCDGVLKMFSVEEKENKIKIPQEVKDFLTGIKTSALESVKKNLLQIISQEKTLSQDQTTNTQIEWPNLTILREHFSDFLIHNVNKKEQPDSYKIIDVFVYGNDLKYNSRSYENLPPLVRVETADNLRKEFGLDEDPDAKPWREYNSIDHISRVEALVEQFAPEDDVKVKFSWMYE